MAERGRETLRHGPMKPFGLTNPHEPQVKAYAIVQLRQDNKLGTLFNMVGFQTKLKHGEQTRIFRTIPGLEKAEFARLGGLHRNTFLNSPKLLDADAAAQGRAAAALRRPDHRLRRLCRVRRDRADGGPLRRGRAARRARCAAAADHGAWRAARPHHRRPCRDHRCRSALVPADERQFRAVPAATARCRRRARTASGCAARPRRSPRSARSPAARSPISAQWIGGAPHRSRPNELQHAPSMTRRGSRAARHSIHCRRHCGSGRARTDRPRRAPAARASARPARRAATPARSAAAESATAICERWPAPRRAGPPALPSAPASRARRIRPPARAP